MICVVWFQCQQQQEAASAVQCESLWIPGPLWQPVVVQRGVIPRPATPPHHPGPLHAAPGPTQPHHAARGGQEKAHGGWVKETHEVKVRREQYYTYHPINLCASLNVILKSLCVYKQRAHLKMKKKKDFKLYLNLSFSFHRREYSWRNCILLLCGNLWLWSIFYRFFWYLIKLCLPEYITTETLTTLVVIEDLYISIERQMLDWCLDLTGMPFFVLQ